MENKNRDSDRDKMLEDILSKLGAQEKNSGRTGGGRAARAAASSANRAASERRSYSSESGDTLNRSASFTGKTSSSYLYDSNISGERKAPEVYQIPEERDQSIAEPQNIIKPVI